MPALREELGRTRNTENDLQANKILKCTIERLTVLNVLLIGIKVCQNVNMVSNRGIVDLNISYSPVQEWLSTYSVVKRSYSTLINFFF